MLPIKQGLAFQRTIFLPIYCSSICLTIEQSEVGGKMLQELFRGNINCPYPFHLQLPTGIGLLGHDIYVLHLPVFTENGGVSVHNV